MGGMFMITGTEGEKRQEREFYPALVKDNKGCVPSLEIAVDHLPKEFAGRSLNELLKHTQEWIEKESFKGNAVLWQWFCPDSVDFVALGPVPAGRMPKLCCAKARETAWQCFQVSG
jgi:hypothetical protein